jgi:Arc/MetJ-type ribon-helix-helix transcriptional regulator
MPIEITPELERLVQGIYASGQYASETDVVTTALKLLRQREQLQKFLEQGIRELDDGQRISVDEVFTELRQRAAELDGNGA